MKHNRYFIEKLGSFNIDNFKYYPKSLKYFESFKTENEYKIHLENYLKDFRHEVQSLPFNLPSKQSRQTFLNNLYDELLLKKENLHFQFNQAIVQGKKCIYDKNETLKIYFPRYLRKKFLTKARQSLQKMHFIYFSQRDIIEGAIEILRKSAINDSVELKSMEKQINYRFKTNLSSPELSYLFYVILEDVAIDKNFNRSTLSKFIADNFSTKMALNPKPKQIKKHFFDVNDSVKKRVEKIFFELSLKAESK